MALLFGYAWSWVMAALGLVVRQGSVKVAICTQCPSMPAAGTYLPTWINAAMWRWLVMWASDE